MKLRHRLIDPPPSSPLYELEHLAGDAVALAEQIRETVAELRRQDTRGDDDATAE